MGYKRNIYASCGPGVLILLLGVIFLIFSCRREGAGLSSSGKKKSEIKSELKNSRDSMNIIWNEMIEDDDQKIADINRMLQEITYMEDYNESKVNELKAEAAQLKNLRYVQSSMSSPQIDAYDMATDSLLSELYAFTDNIPGKENYPLMDQLLTDIREADKRVLLYRIRYDEFALQYNDLLDQFRDKLGRPYNEWEKAPVFMISTE